MKVRLAAALLPLLLLLTACGAGDWFGEAEDPPLPGQRIAILAFDRGVSADSSLAELPVELPPVNGTQRWVQFGGNAMHDLQHLALGDPLRRAWSSSVGQGRSDTTLLMAQPLIVDGTVFTMDSQSIVTAMGSDSGRTQWQRDLEPEDEDSGYFGGGLAFADGRLFVSTGFGRLVALDAQNGEPLWQQAIPAPMRAAPTVEGGRVFVVTLDNQTFALSATDGSVLWNHAGIQEVAGLAGSAPPAVSGSTVIVAYSSGEIFALLAETGRVLWNDALSSVSRSDPLADLPHIRGAPVVHGDWVFAISHARRMVAIDLRQGLRVWDIELGGVEMPWVAGNFIFQLTNDNQVVCLRREDGRIRWVQVLPRFTDPEDQEGPIRWHGPLLAGGRLFVAGSNGEALALSPADGAILTRIDLPGPAVVPPAAAGGSLYFLAEDGTLAAYR
ncbi:MAG: PQQ-binding-like beta-propeller repeat protein [Kiloniellales bacterium]